MNVALSFYLSYRRGIFDLDTISFPGRFQIWGETLVPLPLNFRHSSTVPYVSRDFRFMRKLTAVCKAVRPRADGKTGFATVPLYYKHTILHSLYICYYIFVNHFNTTDEIGVLLRKLDSEVVRVRVSPASNYEGI